MAFASGLVTESAPPPVKAIHTVLVVDDSAFMRKLIGEMISADPAFHVVGFARNGVDALRQIAQLDPDVVTLDIEMPQLDGMQVLELVMAHAPRRIVVLSAGDEAHGAATMRALELGAVDFVHKPSGPISLDLPVIRDRLISALHTAVSIDINTVRALSQRAAVAVVPAVVPAVPSASVSRVAEQVVVIASSTGGPRALAEVIPALPADLPAAVLIAQHMPKEFTPSLAERLDHASALRVREAVDGESVVGGTVYVGPGGVDLRIVSSADGPRIAIDRGDSCFREGRSGVFPSGDRLFASAASVFGAAVTAVVLTGMGRDGSDGVRTVHAAGGQVIVQDRETSVIFGMPNAALQMLQVLQVLQRAGAEQGTSLGDIAQRIVTCVHATRLDHSDHTVARPRTNAHTTAGATRVHR